MALDKYQENFCKEKWLNADKIERVKNYFYLTAQQSEILQIYLDLSLRNNNQDKALEYLAAILKIINDHDTLNKLNNCIGKSSMKRFLPVNNKRLCIIFNPTSIETSELDEYLNKLNYTVLKSKKIDLEQLNNFQYLDKLATFDHLLIIAFVYSLKGNLLLNTKNYIPSRYKVIN
jgi:superfamily II DNA/RNA helicase